MDITLCVLLVAVTGRVVQLAFRVFRHYREPRPLTQESLSLAERMTTQSLALTLVAVSCYLILLLLPDYNGSSLPVVIIALCVCLAGYGAAEVQHGSHRVRFNQLSSEHPGDAANHDDNG